MKKKKENVENKDKQETENKEILKQDVMEEIYFSKIDEIINLMLANGSLKVSDIVLNKDLSFNEKFDYLKSQILKVPNIKAGPTKDFLYALKGYVIFIGLDVLKEKGYKEAKELYSALASNEDIENARKRLFNE